MFDHIDSQIAQNTDDLVSLRRHLHQNPELSGVEFETTQLLVQKLTNAGFEVKIRPEGTGFYADLAPPNFDPAVHKTIAMRCDLDALAIEELNEVEYVSQKPGIMHACGHDVHMTCVTGAGMAVNRETLPGRLRLIYQHAEEAVPGGALDMIELGAVDGVDHVLGMHVDPELDYGRIGVRNGPFTAAFDTFRFVIHGRSGHGARPHHCVDPILVVTNLVNTLYTTVSRYYDARDPMVITIGIIEGGQAANVIPDTAAIEGAIRTLSREHRDAVQPMLVRVADGVCETFGARYDLHFTPGAPAIINDKLTNEAIAAAGAEILGAERVYQIPLPSMGSEDFSHYLEHCPGAMFRLGVARQGRPKYFLHNARFDVDERAIALGARILARSALSLMTPR